MTWRTGARQPIRFKSNEASFTHFKDIWKRKYSCRFPTYNDAVKWTGNDHASRWLSIVRQKYNLQK